MHPISTPFGWVVPKYIKNHVVWPPIVSGSTGRPRPSMIPSTGEQPVRQNCSHCGNPRHNRQICQNSILLCSTITQSRIRSTRQ